MRKRPNDVEKLDQISQSINSDGKGNLTVGKNLGVDGKLTLKSLVSNTNPDGDITKELGGGGGEELYCHSITLKGPKGRISTNYYNHSKTPFNFTSFSQAITDHSKRISCSGVVLNNNQSFIAIGRYELNGLIWVYYWNTTNSETQGVQFTTSDIFQDDVLKAI